MSINHTLYWHDLPEVEFDAVAHEAALDTISKGVTREMFQRMFVACKAEAEKQGLVVSDELIVEGLTNELMETMARRAREILVNTADKKPGFLARLFGKGIQND